ncbi:MAG: glutathione peroxidase [Candidatus Riflebacteria bacterium]|nr:glutathione peroxidase [Candidatus Riflebacteria bacterium]
MSQLTGTILIIVLIVVIISLAVSPGASHPPEDKKSVLEYTLALADGTPQPLESFRGKVLLLVNVASKCGFTGQYEGLEKLQKKYESEGFTVLAFPANDFLGQEPGTNEEIVTFCRMSYGVTFPVFAKISVIGAEQHPLYRFLTNETTNPGFAGKISWNFNKFLVDRTGKVIARYGSRTVPEDAQLIADLEKALKIQP